MDLFPEQLWITYADWIAYAGDLQYQSMFDTLTSVNLVSKGSFIEHETHHRRLPLSITTN